MIKIALCDDEKQYTTKVEEVLKEVAQDNGIQTEIEVFFDGSDLVDYMIKNEVCYDLIFLDIEMKKMNGLETARQIRVFDDFAYLIYITSHDSYAIEAYDVEPFKFLLKPIQEKELTRVFLRVCEKISRDMVSFDYKSGSTYCKVILDDVLYFESNKRKILIHLADGTIEQYYGKLNDVEEKSGQTKKNFWRIHKSFLVNARYIKVKEYNRVRLINGEILDISEDRRKDINLQYASMIEKDMLN